MRAAAPDPATDATHVLAQTDLVYYCGTDMLNLPWLWLRTIR